jgi:hypothetical protein
VGPRAVLDAESIRQSFAAADIVWRLIRWEADSDL